MCMQPQCTELLIKRHTVMEFRLLFGTPPYVSLFMFSCRCLINICIHFPRGIFSIVYFHSGHAHALFYTYLSSLLNYSFDEKFLYTLSKSFEKNKLFVYYI